MLGNVQSLGMHTLLSIFLYALLYALLPTFLSQLLCCGHDTFFARCYGNNNVYDF
jgi:hypothetical protein